MNVNLMISFGNLFKSTTRRLIKHNRKCESLTSGSNERMSDSHENDINKPYMLNLKGVKPLFGSLYKSMVTLT
ncbi:MAG: hypothetical protein ACTS41_00370 [Candidatus Hodgkinia cicadicola]